MMLKRSSRERPDKRCRGAAGKAIFTGFKERAGNLVTEIIPNVRMNTVRKQTLKHFDAGATVSNDGLLFYDLLKSEGYTHVAVKPLSR